MTLMSWDSKKWTWYGGFSTKDIPKAAGMRWDPDGKHWWTTDPVAAAKLADYADAVAKAAIDDAIAARDRSLALSRASDADVDVPVPDGLALLPFQRAGIAYALGRPSTLIADEMGLGKTIQAIGIANATQARQVLIACPLSVKLNWEREIQKWSTADPPLSVGHATAKEWPQTDVVVCHWDVLARHEAELRSRKWDLVALDEAHLAKNRRAQRTQAIFGRKGLPAVEGKVKLALTGTPIPNRVKELWPVLHWLKAPVAEPWNRFHANYCGPELVWQGQDRGEQWTYDGASNLEELQRKLREQVMVRRLKADVLTELPPKRRQVVLLDPADVKGGAVALKKEAERREELRAKARVEAELAKASDDPGAYEAAVRRLRDPGEIEFQDMSEVRHQTALVKAPAVAAHVSDLLNQGTAKVIVWAHHRDVIDILSEALDGYGAVVVTGSTPQAQRQEAVDAFQGEGGPRVFIGNIEAAGVGITLTAASTAVFAELAWKPSDISQCEDRCHRIGQQDAVLVQHVLLDGSFDAKVAKTVLAKQVVADKALDQLPGAAPEPEPAVAEEVPVREEEGEQMATQTTSRDRIAAIAGHMTAEDVSAMHQGVRQLAGWDTDHARSLNGAGFSKLDSALGHELAEKQSLTPKQGALAAVLCQRYRRQLGELGNKASAIVTGKPGPVVDLKLPEPPPLMPQTADDFPSFDEVF
jgi:SWI/SNF-related matrix-associated actin-dependent regulator 1 of chromatin subfamily A